MATIKKTNIDNYLKTKFSNTASHIKMNGSQSAGSSDLVARADHVHPTDTSRAPTSHNHGNLLNNGQVGSTVQADKPLITDSNGKIKIGIFGNGAKTFCEGNDPRLSDKRNPTTNFIDASSTNPVDLNAFREIGFYCTMSNTGAQYVSNCPYSSTGSAPFTNNKMFYLLVESLGNGSNKPFVKQTLTYHDNNNVWVRTKNGGDADDANWSSWEKISLEGHTHQLNDVGLTKIGANADFETYKQQGFYYIDYYNAQSATNMPFKTGGLLIVRNLMGGVSQTFQRYNGTEMWYRTYSNGGEWNGWKKISLEGHTHTKSQIEDFPTSMTPTFHTHNLNNISIETIGENADFNAYGTQALMKIDYYNAQSCDNMPFKTGGLLIVRNLGGGISQTFQRYNGTDMWYRTYYNSRWNDWKKISLDGHTHNLDEIGYKTIGANADFESDTYKEQGFYHINHENAQSATNMPFKTGGLLIVRELGDGISQTFQRYYSSEMWYRTYYRGGNQWSDWKKISLDGHTHTKSQISDFSHTHGLDEVSYKTIGANADFESDTYKEQGFYHINHENAQSATNMPFKTGGLLIVRELGDGISQTFQRYNGEAIWYRTYYRGNNTWSSWKEIIFKDTRIKIRLIRAYNNGSPYPDSRTDLEGTELVVANGSKMGAKLYSDSSISLAGRHITLVYWSSNGYPSIVKTTTDADGITQNMIEMTNNLNGIGFAILKGTDAFDKDTDIKYVRYG